MAAKLSEREGGYRIGKITPDALLATSKHIGSVLAFLATTSSGPFAIALPDSGLGGWAEPAKPNKQEVTPHRMLGFVPQPNLPRILAQSLCGVTGLRALCATDRAEHGTVAMVSRLRGTTVPACGLPPTPLPEWEMMVQAWSH